MYAYDTKVASNFKKTANEIKNFAEEALIINQGDFIPVLGSDSIFKISVIDQDRPQWDLPIVLETKKGEEKILIDTRPFENEVRVRRADELEGSIERAVLELNWVKRPELFESLTGPVVVAYTDWITSLIRSRMSLTEAEEVTLTLWIAFYYYTAIVCAQRTVASSEEHFLAFERFASRTLNIRAPIVKLAMPEQQLRAYAERFDREEYQVKSLDFYIQLAKEVVDTPALENFGASSVIVLASTGSWMGHAATIIAAGAVEYPPLFIHMANQSLKYGLRRKTRVGQSVEGLRRRRIDSSPITRTVNGLIEDMHGPMKSASRY